VCKGVDKVGMLGAFSNPPWVGVVFKMKFDNTPIKWGIVYINFTLELGKIIQFSILR